MSEKAREIYDAITKQNWKLGGVLTMDRPEGEALIDAALTEAEARDRAPLAAMFKAADEALCEVIYAVHPEWSTAPEMRPRQAVECIKELIAKNASARAEALEEAAKARAILELWFSPWGAAKAAKWEELSNDAPFNEVNALELIAKALGIIDEKGAIRASKEPTPLNQEELNALVRDPRYWRDRDPAFVKRVADGFRRLYHEQAKEPTP